MATDEEIEAACRGMYGKHWDGPPEKMPGPQMKDVWRKYARAAIEAVDVLRKGDPIAWCCFCKKDHPGGATCMGHYP